MKTTNVTDMKNLLNAAKYSICIMLSTVRCWYRANMKYFRYWRVTYENGEKTRLLHKAEAEELRDFYDGRMWIDYKHCR